MMVFSRERPNYWRVCGGISCTVILEAHNKPLRGWVQRVDRSAGSILAKASVT